MRFTSAERRALGFTFSSISLLIAAGAAAAESKEAPLFERKTLEEHIRFLSSDELGGRGNGTAGLREAARYIASRFGELALVPAGEGGTYFQAFRVVTGDDVGTDTRAGLRSRSGVRALAYGADFEPLTLSASGEVTGPVVFAGYGVTAPEHAYDDYGSIDARGKIVLVLRYAPEPFGERGWHATFVRKAENAALHGARALVVVNGPQNQREDELVRFGVDVGARSATIPVIHLRRKHGEDLLRGSGRSLSELQSRIREELTPHSFEIPDVELALNVDLHRTDAEVENVLGFLPATDRVEKQGFARADEYVVIGAHYDHLGLGEKGSRDSRAKGTVHNGADDNASGVAGVLELARLFSRVERRPRGILFAAFAGEELGLRGSSHFTGNATLPLDDAVFMINLDMIGRLRHDRLYLGGADLVPEMRSLIEAELTSEGMTLSGRFIAEEASDHAPFLRAGVPSLFFFTGLHGDYHKPTDDSQFINFEGMERVLRVGYRLSDYLLKTQKRPVLASGQGQGARGVALAGPSRDGAYFGISVDPSFEGEGVRFAYVESDGPAAHAGLEAGDVLLELDGRAIRSTERAALLIRERRPGDTVSAKVRRNDRILEVRVRLSSHP